MLALFFFVSRILRFKSYSYMFLKNFSKLVLSLVISCEKCQLATWKVLHVNGSRWWFLRLMHQVLKMLLARPCCLTTSKQLSAYGHAAATATAAAFQFVRPIQFFAITPGYSLNFVIAGSCFFYIRSTTCLTVLLSDWSTVFSILMKPSLLVRLLWIELKLA